ncbi:MAG: hypothetical protein PWP51_1403 [Clostridiales bacterium]|jgi:hypothetical protein|nr:hypothetical protein [Clostridiales bacterium]MDN5298850.1 hypothetical protein [Clostridiales bacterium]
MKIRKKSLYPVYRLFILYGIMNGSVYQTGAEMSFDWMGGDVWLMLWVISNDVDFHQQLCNLAFNDNERLMNDIFVAIFKL